MLTCKSGAQHRRRRASGAMQLFDAFAPADYFACSAARPTSFDIALPVS